MTMTNPAVMTFRPPTMASTIHTLPSVIVAMVLEYHSIDDILGFPVHFILRGLPVHMENAKLSSFTFSIDHDGIERLYRLSRYAAITGLRLTSTVANISAKPPPLAPDAIAWFTKWNNLNAEFWKSSCENHVAAYRTQCDMSSVLKNFDQYDQTIHSSPAMLGLHKTLYPRITGKCRVCGHRDLNDQLDEFKHQARLDFFSTPSKILRALQRAPLHAVHEDILADFLLPFEDMVDSVKIFPAALATIGYLMARSRQQRRFRLLRERRSCPCLKCEGKLQSTNGDHYWAFGMHGLAASPQPC